MKELGAMTYQKGAYPFFEDAGTWQVISGRRYPLRPHVPLDPEKCRIMAGLLRGASDRKAGKKLRRKLAALAFAMALSVVIPGFVSPAKAATYTAGCSGSTGNVPSLITAINSANTNPGPDTVSLGASCIYNLTAVDNYWYGPNGLPPIASDITIEGNGATIQRDATAQPTRLRFFYVGADPVNNTLSLDFNTPGAGKLTLRNLTLKNGRQQGGNGPGGGAGMGGAIFNQGALILDGVFLTGNAAFGGEGNHYETAIGGGMGGPEGFGGPVTPAGSQSKGGGNFGMSGGGACCSGGGGFGVNDNGISNNGGGAENGLGGGSYGWWGHYSSGNGSGGGWHGGGVGGGGGYNSGGGFGGGGGADQSNYQYGQGGFGGGGAQYGSAFGGGGHSGGGAGLGGAIFNHTGDVTITNGSFSGNVAQGGNGSIGGSGFGAALFNLNGTVSIINSTIMNNSVQGGNNGGAGGALYNLGLDGNLSPHATMAVSGDTVVSNTTGGSDIVNNRPVFVSVYMLNNKATATLIGPSVNAPSGLTAKALSSSKIDISWNDNSVDETGFKIERRLGNCDAANGDPWVQIAVTAADASLYADAGRAANATYSYRVKAYNATGETDYSNCAYEATAKAGTPASPTNLKAESVASGKITLSWKDNSNNETGFKIYRKAGADSWVLLTATPVPAGKTKYTDATAVGNNSTTSYSYYIRACNSKGCSVSSYAAVVPIRPVRKDPRFRPYPDIKGVHIYWEDKSNNETGFQVSKKPGKCSDPGTWVMLPSTQADADMYIDEDVIKGQTYSYKFRAYRISPGKPYATGYSNFYGCSSKMFNEY